MTPEQKSPKPQPIVGEGAPKAKATVVEEAPKVEPIVVEASGSECQTLEVVAPQQQNGTSLQQTNSTTPKSEDSYDPKKDNYIDGRWKDQYDYFRNKANKSQKWFNFIQITILVLGFLSVFILSFDLDSFCSFNSSKFSLTKVLCAFMSGVIVVLTGYDKLKNFKEEWIKNRKNEEMLKREWELCKGGIEPYASLLVEEEEDEEPKKSLATSERTKKLLTSLVALTEDYDDTMVKELYKKIKKEISNYLAGDGDYAGMADEITDKDKSFVSRIDDFVDKNRQLLDITNLFNNIQNEVSDFYTDGGVYKVDSPVKKKKRNTLEDIKAENERLLIARTEAIIANDVAEFVKAKTSNTEQKTKENNGENVK